MKTGLRVRQTVRLTSQAGFIQGAILFGIALLIAVIGGFSLANSIPQGSKDNQQAKLNASVFIKQGYNLREGTSRYAFDKLSSDGMTFDSAIGTGLFDSTKQYAIVQVGPTLSYGGGTAPNVLPSDPRAGSYAIHRGITVPEVGTASAEWLAATVFSDLLTCQAINVLLFGLSAPASPPTTALTAAQWQSGSGAETLVGSAAGWNEGCLQTTTADASGNKYVYFRVIREG